MRHYASKLVTCNGYKLYRLIRVLIDQFESFRFFNEKESWATDANRFLGVNLNVIACIV